MLCVMSDPLCVMSDQGERLKPIRHLFGSAVKSESISHLLSVITNNVHDTRIWLSHLHQHLAGNQAYSPMCCAGHGDGSCLAHLCVVLVMGTGLALLTYVLCWS